MTSHCTLLGLLLFLEGGVEGAIALSAKRGNRAGCDSYLINIMDKSHVLGVTLGIVPVQQALSASSWSFRG